jgi:hypothetical protein
VRDGLLTRDAQAPPEQKAHFNELARIEKEEHAKK